MAKKLYNPGYNLGTRMLKLSTVMLQENITVNGIDAVALKEKAKDVAQKLSDYDLKYQEAITAKGELLKSMDEGYQMFDQCYRFLRSLAKWKPEIFLMLKEISRRRKLAKRNTEVTENGNTSEVAPGSVE